MTSPSPALTPAQDEPRYTRHDCDVMALRLLSKRPDGPGRVLDSEEKLAAAMIYMSLNDRGLAVFTPTDDGPVYHITPAGRRWLAEHGHAG